MIEFDIYYRVQFDHWTDKWDMIRMKKIKNTNFETFVCGFCYYIEQYDCDKISNIKIDNNKNLREATDSIINWDNKYKRIKALDIIKTYITLLIDEDIIIRLFDYFFRKLSRDTIDNLVGIMSTVITKGDKINASIIISLIRIYSKYIEKIIKEDIKLGVLFEYIFNILKHWTSIKERDLYHFSKLLKRLSSHKNYKAHLGTFSYCQHLFNSMLSINHDKIIEYSDLFTRIIDIISSEIDPDGSSCRYLCDKLGPDYVSNPKISEFFIKKGIISSKNI